MRSLCGNIFAADFALQVCLSGKKLLHLEGRRCTIEVEAANSPELLEELASVTLCARMPRVRKSVSGLVKAMPFVALFKLFRSVSGGLSLKDDGTGC